MTEERKGWIGVDLDGTLAYYDGWHGESHVGAPVPLMVERVKEWLSEGRYDVKVFTARVSTEDAEELKVVTRAIHAWCEEHVGQRLEVTCRKDYRMVALYDDRATQVVPNEGVTLEDELARLRQEAENVRAVEAWAREGRARGGRKVVLCDGVWQALEWTSAYDGFVNRHTAPTLAALGARIRETPS